MHTHASIDESRWSLSQALGWIISASEMETQKIRDSGESCFDVLLRAQDAGDDGMLAPDRLSNALERGLLVALGIKRGEAEHTEIPSSAWHTIDNFKSPDDTFSPDSIFAIGETEPRYRNVYLIPEHVKARFRPISDFTMANALSWVAYRDQDRLDYFLTIEDVQEFYSNPIDRKPGFVCDNPRASLRVALANEGITALDDAAPVPARFWMKHNLDWTDSFAFTFNRQQIFNALPATTAPEAYDASNAEFRFDTPLWTLAMALAWMIWRTPRKVERYCAKERIHVSSVYIEALEAGDWLMSPWTAISCLRQDLQHGKLTARGVAAKTRKNCEIPEVDWYNLSLEFAPIWGFDSVGPHNEPHGKETRFPLYHEITLKREQICEAYIDEKAADELIHPH